MKIKEFCVDSWFGRLMLVAMVVARHFNGIVLVRTVARGLPLLWVSLQILVFYHWNCTIFLVCGVFYQPILEKTVAWLNFPKLVYRFLDMEKNNACVRVNHPNSGFGFLFYGGEADSAEESRERATQNAVQRLFLRFKIRVADFTYDRVKMYQLCEQLFKHKCAEIVQKKKRNDYLDDGDLSTH
ncbi:uncharacterized protein LOC110734719 [Chenopodium quinoa]|uniref:uncharacterized protein LOC110734719 n=1 Tax=Chenopodium quinoa TaxID=63459 RepID=UPI000B76E10B|nr:uncharacterized protein LOC110734719 [Chenopodium quinoa]